jgi:hypothetical protein
MQGARISKLLIGGGIAAAILLAIVGTLFYGSYKKQGLESRAVSHVATATALLQEGIALPLEAQGTAGKLEEHGRAVAKLLESLKREDAKRNRALADAAELYLVEALAMLRNRANAARMRAAASASRHALAGHMAAAGGRGPGWIQNALALKQRAERESFEYRNALRAYTGLLQGHHETQAKLRAARPGVKLLEEAQVRAAIKAAQDAEQQAVADLEKLRALVF